MEPIDKERFGTFLLALRKEKGFTQKEIAERLFVSDKAVSKWERGQSLPDISLLTPLGELLGVTVTELLRGERLEADLLEACEAEKLVSQALDLSAEERETGRRKRRKWRLAWLACMAVAAVEIMALAGLGIPGEEMLEVLLLPVGMMAIFGGCFCCLVKERLPAYYDAYAINVYSDTFFNMKLPGVRFHNGNWPYILGVGRYWTLGALVLTPVSWLAIRRWVPVWGEVVFQLLICLGYFVPMVRVGRKYQ